MTTLTRKRLFGVLVLLLITVFVVAACGAPAEEEPSEGAEPEQQEPAQESTVPDQDTFNFATNEEIPTLDPAVSYENTGFREMYVMYDRLVTYEGTSTEPVPMLAKDWEVSDDLMTYTFHLRQDAKFHDGSPVTAEDVRYTFERLISMGKGPSGLWAGILEADGVEVIDDYTVAFHLDTAYPPFIALLGMNMNAIINSELVKAHEEDGDWGEAWLTSNDAGSGPFALESWSRGEEMVIVANPDYWGGAPKLSKVRIQIVPEGSTQRLMLEQGELDAAEGIDTEAIEKLMDTEGVKVVEEPGLGITYMPFNCQKVPFDNVVARQAVSYAVDYQAIIDGVALGHAIPLRSPIPKGLLGYDESLPLYEQDLDKAQELADEAGLDGQTIQLYIASFSSWQKIATAVQSDLAKIGVKVEIQQFAWPTYLEKIMNGEHDLAIMGWTPDFADPDQNMWTHLHSSNVGPGWNLSFYVNEDVDELMAMARGTNNEEDRAKYYYEAQQIAIDEAASMWMYQSNAMWPMREWVQGYELNPMNSWYFPFQKMWKEE